MGVVEGVNLDISRLSVDTSSEVIDRESVGSQETRQLCVDSAGNGISGVEVKNPRDEAVGPSPRVDEEALENFSQVAVATVGSDWRKGVVWGNESLGLPGGHDSLMHGVICDGDWLGFGGEGNLELIDGEENSARRVGDDVVGDERPLGTPNPGLV